MILISLLVVASFADGAQGCSQGARTYRHKSELPVGVMAAFGKPMADIGERFNTSDVVDSGDPNALPQTQFVEARQEGCRLVLTYKQGGRGLHEEVRVFQLTAGQWFAETATVLRAPSGASK